jgi:prepilin-type N-terminal cleavage/methylation domain-containing protein
MLHPTKRIRIRQQGFSLLEMLFATVILLVGLVAVAQLVPASILMNYHNRTDSAVMVFAQRQLDILLDQPLNPPGNSFTDLQGNTYQLGDPTQPNVLQGSNVVTLNGYTVIDFGIFGSPAPPAYPTSGYAFTYQDPTDPNNATYDVRWAVIITGNSTTASSKRFILGVRQLSGSGFSLPITLDTMVSR